MSISLFKVTDFTVRWFKSANPLSKFQPKNCLVWFRLRICAIFTLLCGIQAFNYDRLLCDKPEQINHHINLLPPLPK